MTQWYRGLLLLLVGVCPVAQARDTPLPPAVSSALKARGIAASSLSVYAEDLATGEILLSHNAEQLRQPASTIKVLTTFVALDELGPAYTWKTRAYAGGGMKNGVLDGDLVLVGGGDPYMTSDRWWTFVTELRRTGLTTITGDIIIDRSYFEPLTEDRSAFDDAPEKSYNVIPDALMVNFQTTSFTLTGNVTAGKPELVVQPSPANLQVDNAVRVVSGNCNRDYQNVSLATPLGSNGDALALTGSMVPGCRSWTRSRAIMTAPSYAYGTFKTFFEQQGGRIDGTLRVATLPAQAQLLLSYDSLTLGEIIRLVNKYSNNIMARTLLLTLGAEKYGAPASVEKGRRAINDWLKRHRIDLGQFVVDNGSGLSRLERSTAVGMARLLTQAWQNQYMPEFAASLPLAATDGTLRQRFQAASMRGRMRLKTGSIENVAGLAGFVNAASGKNYVVVTLVNQPGAQNGSGFNVEAEILRWVFGQ
ncbi:MAG: D-alanyl-D-alanine carboxypeptidase/D-alanyl-D-alanine-endopeptidase [Steroidobacteraceae bacterium]